MHILLVGTSKIALTELQSGLEQKGALITWAESCAIALSSQKEAQFDLVITDEKLTDGRGLDCIEKIVSLNPFCNCAAISSLSSDDFHEASEGLGVLMQLPVNPTTKDAEKLIDHLSKITTLTHKKP
jgi:DNA-binding NtrC family response regulator